MSVQIADGAYIDQDFSVGATGRYEIGVTIEAVPLSAPKRQILNASYWTDALANAGFPNVRAVSVRASDPIFTDLRSTNPALDTIEEIAGKVPDRNVADFHYIVTVDVTGDASGVGGLGEIGTGTIVLALVVIAGAFAIYDVFSGKNTLVEIVKKIADAIGTGLARVGSGVAETVLYVGGALLLVLFLSKKMGAKISTKYVST